MPSSRLIFLNLPVADVAASRAFFTALGLEFDEAFSSEETACLALSEHGYVMLLSHERFADFASRPRGDARATTSAIVAVSAGSREEVDVLADAALAAGGEPAQEPQDHGFMYGRSFLDLDGHHWEVMWMDQQAAGDGSAAEASPAASA